MQKHIKYLGYYLLISLIAFGLKYHYSRAGSEQLAWILAPTAGTVQMLSGLPFEQEFGEGYINYEYALIIAPSCAGVNFLIAAFCMGSVSFLHLFTSCRKRVLWLITSLFASYLLTVFANAVRILLGLLIYQTNIAKTWLSPEQAHRLEGIVVYFFFLSLYYLLLDAITNMDSRFHGNGMKMKLFKHWSVVNMFSPLFWYLCIALVAPFIHQLYRREFQLSLEHVLSVISSCSLILIFLSIGKISCRKLLKVDKVERIP